MIWNQTAPSSVVRHTGSMKAKCSRLMWKTELRESAAWARDNSKNGFQGVRDINVDQAALTREPQ